MQAGTQSQNEEFDLKKSNPIWSQWSAMQQYLLLAIEKKKSPI